MTLHEARIARRGKGAKGSVEVKTFGTPKVDDNGIAKGFDYSDLESFPPSEAMEIAQKRGHSISKLIFMALDSIEKSAAIKAQNARGMLMFKIAKEFNLSMKEDAKKVRAFADTVIKSAMLGLSQDEAIELLKKAQK